MRKRHALIVVALVAVGCNALTGVGDLAIVDGADASIDADVPDVVTIADSSNDVQQPSPEDAAPDAHADALPDVVEEDSAPPPPVTLYASCAALLAAEPTTQTGKHTIKPANTAIDVFCDMTTAPGGWTEVFRWNAALDNGQANYQAGTLALVNASQIVLMAYRDLTTPTAAIMANAAYFPTPDAWRLAAPFTAAGTDVALMVSIDGATMANTTLRFGIGNFNTLCGDDWIDGTYGRICIEGTTAPFFSGWSTAEPDYCTTSDVVWNATACATTRAFSIAVQ